MAEHLPVLAGAAAARRRVGGDPSWEEPLLVLGLGLGIGKSPCWLGLGLGIGKSPCWCDET